MKDLDTKKKFVELRASGQSYDKISTELSVSKPTLIEWGKQLDREVTELKDAMMQEVHLQYQISKEGRKQALSYQILLILDALRSRDLSGVKTEKLMELLVKTTNALDKIETKEEDETDPLEELLKELEEHQRSVSSKKAAN
jgi:transposase